jgi:hypothetical protein
MYRIGCGVFVAAASDHISSFLTGKGTGGTPEDVKLAITSPHEYAWQLSCF